MVNAILKTSDKQIWVGTNGGGISVFDVQGNFIKLISFKEPNSGLVIDRMINSLYQDKIGNIWIGTIENGLIKIKSKRTNIT